jgi:hypothetical protein
VARSLLWIVGVTNAINLLDGLDGSPPASAAIIGATLTVIAWQAGQPFGVFLGLALVGALLGFLPTTSRRRASSSATPARCSSATRSRCSRSRAIAASR